jgi:hypothetical protein
LKYTGIGWPCISLFSFNFTSRTHSLPIKQWYYENTSESTLDYPPFFGISSSSSHTCSAWFEFLLSKLASLVDPQMLKINHLFYASYETILFQRLTVLFISDLFYYLSLKLYFKKKENTSFFLFCYFLPSLIIIDSIPIDPLTLFRYSFSIQLHLILSLCSFPLFHARREILPQWSGILYFIEF